MLDHIPRDRIIQEVITDLKELIGEEGEGKDPITIASYMIGYFHAFTDNIEDLEAEYPQLELIDTGASDLETRDRSSNTKYEWQRLKDMIERLDKQVDNKS